MMDSFSPHFTGLQDSRLQAETCIAQSVIWNLELWNLESVKESETLFFTAGKDCLKMRRFFFPGYDADLDLPEAGILQPAMQIAFGKTEPAVAIGIARLFKAVLQQIQNQDLAPGAQQSMGCGNGGRRIFRVMQRLAQNQQGLRFPASIGGFCRSPKPEFEIFQSVFPGLGRAKGHNLFGVVYGNHFFAAARQQFAQQPFPGTKIRDHQRRHDAQARDGRIPARIGPDRTRDRTCRPPG